ncbi:MAG TPA: glycosyltransferase [Methylomirabilota bacterium]|nr:glycosyltransferase [Methylomirabilota bacterium]
MKIVMFYHTLLSDWNHGNAHFLRGVATDLLSRGHVVEIYEPRDSWSLQNLLKEHGDKPIKAFQKAYPLLDSRQYDLKTLNLDVALADADLVLVHEWSDHELVRRVGQHRKERGGYKLLFHDTHHRMVTAPESMGSYDLTQYDGVLAYGQVLKDLYLSRGATRRAWVWHEAADTRVFKPVQGAREEGDLVWVGNWGDEERTAELHEFILEPVKRLGLNAQFYGVRYPDDAKNALASAGIRYGGWLANFEAPNVFARFKVTAHVPRRPYVQALPGIPTIRPFEALACGIPLVCSPWSDAEGLFRPGKDFLTANNGQEMATALKRVLTEPALAGDLKAHGLETIHARHTCAHRVDELLTIADDLSRAA